MTVTPVRLAVVVTLALVVGAAGIADEARGQPSAPAPAHPANLLIEAGAAADRGDWALVIARATPVTRHPAARTEERAEAHRLLGLAAYAQGRVDDADRELFVYLQLDPDGHLDPHLYPPETVAFFESVRTRHARELRALRPRPARARLLNLLPPLGQFQNGHRTKGWLLAGLGGAMLTANVGSYLLVRSWCDEDDGTCEVDGRSRRPAAERMLTVNRITGAAAIAVYAYGVIDGFRHYRRRPVVVLAPPATGEGAVLGVWGSF